MKNQVLGLVVIVLLLIVGTNDSFAQNTEIQSKGKQEVVAEKQSVAKKSHYKRQIDIWKERLDLTNAQMVELESDLAEYVAAVQDVKENLDLSSDEKKMEMLELRKAYDAQFRTHLTKEQQAKFDSIRGTRSQLKAKETKSKMK